MKVVIIGDRNLVLGCALAGVKEGYEVNDLNTVREAFSRCMERNDIGIILIGARAASLIPDEIVQVKKSSRLIPVVTVVLEKQDEKIPIGSAGPEYKKVQEF